MADSLSDDLASLKIDRTARPPRSKALTWLATTAILAAAAIAVWVYGYPQLEARVFKTTVSVTEISSLSPAQSSVVLTATGYVVPQILSKVGTKIPGRVARVLVREGQVVAVGDVLVELDASDQESAIAAANARTLAARARAATTRANLAEIAQQARRQESLVASGASPRSTLEDVQARHDSLAAGVRAADAEVAAMHAEVTALRVNRGQLTIVAPVSGTVLTKPVEVGEAVGNALVDIVQIADLSSQLIEIDVPERRLESVRVGAPCEIVLDAFPTRRFRGAVAELGQRVDRSKATVIVKVRFVDTMDGVLPDMSARVSFLSQVLTDEQLRQPEKAVVPARAVVNRNGRDVVFEVENGRVKLRPVRLGPRVGDAFELLEGPSVGTQLVTDPPSTLVDGHGVRTSGGE